MAIIAGSTGKYFPIIGSAIDYGSQVYGGENSTDSVAKTGAHAIAGTVIGLAVGSIAVLPFLGGVALVVVSGFLGNTAIDYAYDKMKKPVGNAVKAGVDWIGSLWK